MESYRELRDRQQKEFNELPLGLRSQISSLMK